MAAPRAASASGPLLGGRRTPCEPAGRLLPAGGRPRPDRGAGVEVAERVPRAEDRLQERLHGAVLSLPRGAAKVPGQASTATGTGSTTGSIGSLKASTGSCPSRTLSARAVSSSPSHFETATEATPFPIRFVIARASDM